MFVPEYESTILPPAYGNFPELRHITKKVLPALRDYERYPAVYEAMWTAFCMHLDFDSHQDLDTTRKKVISSISSTTSSTERAALVTNANSKYLQGLEAASIYPFFIDTRSELRKSGYPVKVVQTWNPDQSGNTKEKEFRHLVQLAARIYPHIFNTELFLHSFFGFSQNSLNKSSFYENNKRLLADLENANVSEDMMGYVGSLRLLTGSRRVPHHRLLSRIETIQDARDGKGAYEVESKERLVEQLLRSIEPYYYLSSALSAKVLQREQVLFGEDRALAAPLWSSLVNLRYSVLPDKVTNTSIRQPLLQTLIARDYRQAWEYLEEAVARYPGLIPQFAVENLGLESDILRGILEEEKDRQKTIPSKRNKPPLTPYQEAIKKIKGITRTCVLPPEGWVRYPLTRYRKACLAQALPALSDDQLKRGMVVARGTLYVDPILCDTIISHKT